MKSVLSNARLKGKYIAFRTIEFKHEEITELGMDYELGIIQRSLRLMGIWPFWNRFSNLKFCICSAILTAVVLSTFIGIFHSKDIEEFISFFMFFIINSTTLLKFFIFKYKRRSIEFIFKSIIDNCSQYPYLSVLCKKRVANNIKIRKFMTLTLAVILVALSAGKYMKILSKHQRSLVYSSNIFSPRGLGFY